MDGTPWRASEHENWPPLASLYTAECVDDDLFEALADHAGAYQVETMLGGDYICVPPEREHDLIRILGEYGIVALHDDELISRLE